MKFEITQPKARVAGKIIEIGETITIDGDTVPASLVGKGRVVGGVAEKVAVTNPAKGADPELDKLRADYQSVIGKKPHHALSSAKLQAAIDEALAS